MTSEVDIAAGGGGEAACGFPWGAWSGIPYAGGLDEEGALRYCLAAARAHEENFPVVFGLLDRDRMRAAAAVYAFARAADDFADEPEFEGRRLDLLDAWERELSRSFDARVASNPVFVALRWAAGRYGLPRAAFSDLLSAFRQDCTQHRYETFGELLDYCRRSANPVGRLMLAIMGVDGEEAGAWSDAICTGLQLANFWQDVSVDARKDRIYVPREDLRRFGVAEERLLGGGGGEGFARLMRFEISRTRRFFREGRPLARRAGWPASLYLGMVWLGGMSILGLASLDAERLGSRRPSLTAAGVLGQARRLVGGRR